MKNKTIYKITTISIILFIFFTPSFSLDEKAKSKTRYNPTNPKDAEIHGKVDEGKVVIYSKNKKFNETTGWVELIDDPYILTSTDYLTARIMKYHTKNKMAQMFEHVKIRNFDNRIIIVGEEAEYNTDTKRAWVRDNARMYADDDKILMKSNEMERISEEERVIARGDVEITRLSDNTKIFSDNAIYEMGKKIIKLEGNPRIEYEDYVYKADRMTMYTKDEKSILEGNCSIIKGKKEAKADRIEYFSKGEIQAILIGNSKLTEFSRDESVLKGNPINIATANKIVYYNEKRDHALLEGNAHFINYDVSKVGRVDAEGMLTYKVTKQEGYANNIEYFGGSDEKITLNGKAILKQPNQVATANTIYFYPKDDNKIILDGNAKTYMGYTKEELKRKIAKANGKKVKRIKRKAIANKIEYESGDEDHAVLTGDAILFEEDREASGDKIDYYGGDVVNVIIQGNARFKDKNNEATGNKIEFYDDEPPIFILDGDVAQLKTLNENERTVEAKRIYYYDGDLKKAILLGNPKVIEKNQIATGDMIEYYDSEDEKRAAIVGNAKLEDKVDNKTRIITADVIDYQGEGDDKPNHFWLHGKITMIDGERKTTSDKGEYHTIPIKNQEDPDSKIILEGNVKTIEKDQKMYADILRLYDFGDKGNDETKILLAGNVRVEDETRVVKSDTLEYHKFYEAKNNYPTEKIIFLGNPKENIKINLNSPNETVDNPEYSDETKTDKKSKPNNDNKLKYLPKNRISKLEKNNKLSDKKITDKKIDNELKELDKSEDTKDKDTKDKDTKDKDTKDKDTKDKDTKDKDTKDKDTEDKNTEDKKEKSEDELKKEAKDFIDSFFVGLNESEIHGRVYLSEYKKEDDYYRVALAYKVEYIRNNNQNINEKSEDIILTGDALVVEQDKKATGYQIIYKGLEKDNYTERKIIIQGKTIFNENKFNKIENEAKRKEITDEDKNILDNDKLKKAKDKLKDKKEEEITLDDLDKLDKSKIKDKIKDPDIKNRKIKRKIEKKKKPEDNSKKSDEKISLKFAGITKQNDNTPKSDNKSNSTTADNKKPEGFSSEDDENKKEKPEGFSSEDDENKKEKPEGFSSEDDENKKEKPEGFSSEDDENKKEKPEGFSSEDDENKKEKSEGFSSEDDENKKEKSEGFSSEDDENKKEDEEDNQVSKLIDEKLKDYKEFLSIEQITKLKKIGKFQDLSRKYAAVEDQTRNVFGEIIIYTSKENDKEKEETVEIVGKATAFETSRNAKGEIITYMRLNKKDENQKIIEDKREEYTIIENGAEVIEKDDDGFTRSGKAKQIEWYKTKDKEYAEFYDDVELVDEKEQTELNSGYLYYNILTEYLRAEKDPVVYLRRDNAEVASEIIEYFRPDEMAYGKGDVQITQSGNVVVGEEAEFDQKRDLVTVRGNVVLKQGNSYSKARKVLYHLKTKELKVLGKGKAFIDTGDNTIDKGKTDKSKGKDSENKESDRTENDRTENPDNNKTENDNKDNENPKPPNPKDRNDSALKGKSSRMKG